MRIKAALWDCDGTLVDSEYLAMKVALDTAYGHFGKEYDPALISTLSGKSFRQICEAVEGNVGGKISPEAYGRLDKKQLEETIRILAAHVEPTAGTFATLGALPKDLPSAIVTSSPLERINPCVDRVLEGGVSLRQFFPKERVFSAEDPAIFPDGPRNKPDPSIYLHAMKTLGLDGTTCFTLEDSLSGVKSAVRAGVPVVGYVGGKHIGDKEGHAARLREAAAHPGADYPGIPDMIVLRDMKELPAVLAHLEKASSYQEAAQAYGLSVPKESVPSLNYSRSSLLARVGEERAPDLIAGRTK